jgi:hypothetical protein
MAEDLLGVALEAAAGGSGTVARAQLDEGIDLYFRRLRSMLTVLVQVKAILLVSQDATVSLYVPQADLHALSRGYLAIVHIPPPHDQLYERLFLIPVDEFRRRATRVTYHGVACYRFTAEFAGLVRRAWEPFAVQIDQLPAWVAALPGWSKIPAPPPLKIGLETLTKAENHNIAEIGRLWAAGELQRVALDRVAIIDDRVRIDPVTFIVHHLRSGRIVGVHLRTAIFNKTRRIHFDVKQHHWFADPDLWVVLVLLRPDRRVHDYVLLIPSTDMSKLGLSETLTLDPLTKRFRKYQVSSPDFGKAFMDAALAGRTAGRFGDLMYSLQEAS